MSFSGDFAEVPWWVGNKIFVGEAEQTIFCECCC